MKTANNREHNNCQIVFDIYDVAHSKYHLFDFFTDIGRSDSLARADFDIFYMAKPGGSHQLFFDRKHLVRRTSNLNICLFFNSFKSFKH
jgi:hypothetical protein